VAESPSPFSGILETVLYCPARDREDVERFYADVLGLPAVARWEDGTSFRVGPGVLLIFDLEKLARRRDPIADHGSAGPGHACLLADGDDYAGWKQRLDAHSVAIVHEHEWGNGRHSLYFRDPAGNLLEIASGDLWPLG
jgi:catechol 2,3-dioxygenase-like lactoylglutathione lyase family enzyme